MTIYLDLILGLNFSLDLILLIIVKCTLKRWVAWYHLIGGALIGSLSVLFLLIKLNQFGLLVLKLITSIVMVLVCFGFRSWRYTINNLLYLYLSSVTLGGLMYLINLHFSYQAHGFLFFNNGLTLNFKIIILLLPLFGFWFIKSNQALKSKYSLYYQVKIGFGTLVTSNLIGYLDTGNRLKDPLTGKPIILVKEAKLKPILNEHLPLYVPIKTVNKQGLIKCYRPCYLVVNHHQFKNYLVGLIPLDFQLDGVDCLLNSNMMEELNV